MIDHENNAERTAVDLDRASVTAERERQVYLARIAVWIREAARRAGKGKAA